MSLWHPKRLIAPQVTLVDVQVFSGTSPTTYTDLDLSGVVGANEAIVMLRVYNDINPATYYFRENGRTVDTSPDGVMGGSAGSIEEIYFIVKTDSSGIVEWMSSVAQTTYIWVIAYWK